MPKRTRHRIAELITVFGASFFLLAIHPRPNYFHYYYYYVQAIKTCVKVTGELTEETAGWIKFRIIRILFI